MSHLEKNTLPQSHTLDTSDNFETPSRIAVLVKKIKTNQFIASIYNKIMSHKWTKITLNKFQTLEWNERVAILIGICALAIFVIGPYALLYRNTKTILLESEKRGETLTRLLAASNQAAFTQKLEVLYSTSAVKHQLGVLDAMVMDPSGTILAPVERFGRTFKKIASQVNPQSCTRSVSDSHYEFICPIFKWVETESGFIKKTMGYAYLDYTSDDSLNIAGSRAFQIIKYIIVFLIFFALLAYAIISLTRKALLDFKFNIRAHTRGTTPHLTHPKHFKELNSIAEEIEEYGKHSPHHQPTQEKSQTSFMEILQKIKLFSLQEMLVLSSDKQLVYVTDSLKETLKLKAEQHILRAVQDSPYGDRLLDFFSRLVDSSEEVSDFTLDGVGAFRGMKMSIDGQNHYVVQLKRA